MSTLQQSSGSKSRHADFAATQWTVVLAAADAHAGDASSRAQRALAQLAQTYWFPLYAYIRRHGRPAHEAEDLTQEFFARLLEKKSLANVDRAKGKFRSFLLASLKNFLANEADKAQAQKRGGGQRPLSLDAADAESRYAAGGSFPAVDTMTPERVFEQRWAWTVLDQVLLRLREQYHARGQAPLFDALKTTLTAARETAPYAQLAQELGIPEGTLAVAAHRLRRQYRKLLRDQIAQTVSDPALIDEEISYLLNCL